MKTIQSISLLVMAATLLIGCTADEPKRSYAEESEINCIIGDGTLLTLNELKQAPYMTEKGNYVDPALYRLRTNATGHTGAYAYLDTVFVFALDTIPTDKPLYIRGRITTDDIGGNFYKSLCIQQIVNGKQQALRISVDAGSVGGMYQIGQEILIRVDGLAIGRYANQPQLCVPSYNNNTYATNYKQKTGWAPGRIPFSEFKRRTSLIGLPQTPYCDTILISDVVTATPNIIDARLKDGCLVCVKDVHYTGKYTDKDSCTTGNPASDGNANVFAPTTNNIGYPQSRVIADDNNKEIMVSNSEYAKFARFYLPGADNTGVSNCSKYKGNVVGILGYYYDNNYNTKSTYNPAWDDWSITIRSLDDLQLTDSKGNLWPRLEYGTITL
ncbi:MAG: hypothetical protein IJS00_05220 [Paludibacteraceae bacterium]|nr:hypothetical protein [Paludibacteraceae bacterium]